MEEVESAAQPEDCEENFAACVREIENRHEKEIWLAEVNCRLEKESNALRDELAKRDMAENRRIIKERAKIRASPKSPRRFSQASPIITEAPQTHKPTLPPKPMYDLVLEQSSEVARRRRQRRRSIPIRPRQSRRTTNAAIRRLRG